MLNGILNRFEKASIKLIIIDLAVSIIFLIIIILLIIRLKNKNRKDDFKIEHYPDRKIKDFWLYMIEENGDTKKFKIKHMKDFIDNFEKRLKKYDLTFVLFHKEHQPWLQVRNYVSGEADVITFSGKEAKAFLKTVNSLIK